jgi:hypothetical protein
MQCGQFSIFGAIEEKLRRRFSRIFGGSRELFEHPCDASGRAFPLARCEWTELFAAEGRIVHRACTGNAERQFSVLSSQFSVLSSQFSVLSSQFSVLSSQFSVLSSQFSVLSSQSEMLGTISKLLGDCRFVAPFALSHRFTGITRAEVGCGGRRIYCCARNSFSRWTL